MKTTAPVSDWKALLRQLEELNKTSVWFAWPLSTFVSQIKEVLDRLDKTYHTDKDDAQSPQALAEPSQNKDGEGSEIPRPDGKGP